MQRRRLTRVLVGFALGAAGLMAVIGPAAGQAGKHATSKVTVITVTAGKPSELGFKLSKTSSITAGPVTFKVTNAGKLAHDFKVCTKAVKTSSANACTGVVTKRLNPGQTATLSVKLATAGQYEYLCTVPGHAGAGMKGLIGIGVKTTTTPAVVVPSPKPTTTTTPSSSGPPPATETLVGNPAAGAAVWGSAGCGSCHTLKAASSTGNVGPNLDDSHPGQDLVIQRVTNGINVMPAFGSQLSSTQIMDVAAFVYSSTHT